MPRFTDTVTSLLASTPHPVMVVAHEVITQGAEHLSGLNLGKKLLLVADPQTWLAAGEQLMHVLQERYSVTTHIFPSPPFADIKVADALAEEATSYDALIAVGSGTINDLCKYASHKAGKPYAIFATAPSMNGYTSAGASMVVHGHRKSLPARLPVAVLCDIDILAKAPMRLIRAGLGDSIARSTAQADWLLSHLLLGTPYDDRPFQLTAEIEKELFEDSAGLLERNPDTIRLLVKLLLLSGLGMVMAGGSYPASQGEHMIAHTYEMLHPHDHTSPAWPHHGEQIAVTTLTMARIQQKLLADANLFAPKLVTDTSTLENAFGKEAAAEMVIACELKQQTIRNVSIKTMWSEIQARIGAIHLPAATLELILKDAGVATTPEAIGWDTMSYTTAISLAKFTRERFTFLDLAIPAQTGAAAP